MCDVHIYLWEKRKERKHKTFLYKSYSICDAEENIFWVLLKNFLLYGIEVVSLKNYTEDFSFIPFSFYFIFRQITGNGTLYFPPFLGQYFRADVHEGIYRCKASNQAGTVLSRDVDIRAGKT